MTDIVYYATSKKRLPIPECLKKERGRSEIPLPK